MKFIKICLSATLLTATASLFAAPPAPPAGKRWQPVPALTDEFNGPSIDTNKWYDYHPFWSGRQPSQFKRGNSFVRGGHLQLRSTSRIDNMSQVARPFEDTWVDAAAVVSKTLARPGWYYEVEMKASDTAMSSSFWFRVGKFSEIDVIEHIGRATKSPEVERRKSFEFGTNTHYYGQFNGLQSLGDKYVMPRRGRDGFERYALWWKDPNTLIFYYNGVERMRIKPRRPFTESLRMIFDTETLASTFVGLPTIASLKDNDRNVMRVNWVRTYRLVDAPNNGSAVPSIGQRVAFRDPAGKFLSSSNGRSPMISNRSAALSWETFQIVDAGNGRVALRGNNGRYVSHENGRPMTCNRSSIGPDERFTFVPLAGNTFAIRGNNNRFVSYEQGKRPVVCNRVQAREWETWSFIVK